ncbi:MAG: mannitol-1-phosphate 5-dehydrogenase [Anaerolineae bacterium]|nr:mannitol-1-phosphate 5-dehydrogenase [Anaerolineae bacterium]
MSQQAVIFGAGNVGRGFLGQLFSESGYQVTFVDVDEPLIDALNARRAYTIRLVDNDRAEEVTISPVRALHAGDTAAVAQALAEAEIAATAVGARALPQIAPLVAAGITRRFAGSEPGTFEPETRNPLNIIVCENLKDAAATFRRMVSEHLPATHRDAWLRRVGFVDTVIARMVPPPTPEMRARDPSFIVVEPYKVLPVDRSGFVGPIPAIVGLEPMDNFAAYTASKLYIHNCGHALLGYLGYQRGHTYAYEALDDPAIRPLLEAALAESRAGIVAVHGVDAVWLEAHAADIVRRFANRALGDTVFRLARDPLRKLAPEDRLVGAARLAERAGVTPQALSWGIAAGYCFDDPADPLAVALQQRIAAQGFDAVLAEVSGIAPDEPLAALVRERHRQLREARGKEQLADLPIC